MCRRRSGAPTAPRCSSLLSFAKDQEDAAPLVAVTEQLQRQHPGLEIRQAGDLTIDEAINERVAKDLSSAEGLQSALSPWC